MSEEKKIKVTLIDADSLCYLGKKDDTLIQVLEKVDTKIKTILEKTGAEKYVLFISKGKYFRHFIKDKTESAGSYKSNRKYARDYSKTIKEYLISEYDAQHYEGAEADDAIAYFYKKYKADGITPILAAIDKDLLKSIEGTHLNYNKKVGPEEWDMVWVSTTEDEIRKFFRMQMIVGDPSDGVKGIPGKGIKYWENEILKKNDNKCPRMDQILSTYAANINTVGEVIYQFQKNYRLLHLLDCDEDWLREVGYIPDYPELRDVTTDDKSLPKFD